MSEQYRGSGKGKGLGQGQGTDPKAKGGKDGKGDKGGAEKDAKEKEKEKEEGRKWQSTKRWNRWNRTGAPQTPPEYCCYSCGTLHDLSRYWKTQCRDKRCRAPITIHLTSEEAEKIRKEWEDTKAERFAKAQERREAPKLTAGFEKSVFQLVGEMNEDSSESDFISRCPDTDMELEGEDGFPSPDLETAAEKGNTEQQVKRETKDLKTGIEKFPKTQKLQKL